APARPPSHPPCVRRSSLSAVCFQPVRRPRRVPPFPTRRSSDLAAPSSIHIAIDIIVRAGALSRRLSRCQAPVPPTISAVATKARSEEHTSELQSRENLVCRLLLEKKDSRTNRCGVDGTVRLPRR